MSWPLANVGVTSAPYGSRIMPWIVVDVPRSGNQVVDALETKRVRMCNGQYATTELVI